MVALLPLQPPPQGRLSPPVAGANVTLRLARVQPVCLSALQGHVLCLGSLAQLALGLGLGVVMTTPSVSSHRILRAFFAADVAIR